MYLGAILPFEQGPLGLPPLPEVRSPRTLHDKLGDVDVQVEGLVVFLQARDLVRG